MSDSEEEICLFFGKPLEQYDEDAIPKKKPISVEEQIATDAQGRRRFHGAFTGGFSAGFYNTVGSLEGWRPTEFKSTRTEKAANKTQKPEDFMDDEDIGEFGIAPQTVRATKEYSTSKKRKKIAFPDGPIPGEPVLHSLLTSGNETIGYLLLKNMGYKNRIEEKIENNETTTKVYGCEMPTKTYEISRINDYNQYDIPPIYKDFQKKPKDNTFGLGYSGLDKTSSNNFVTSNLVVREKNKKNLTITGQAFGVGAFEDEDEDIYVKEDMSKYDFEMSTEKELRQKKTGNQTLFFDDFIRGKALNFTALHPPPTIPQSFTGKHRQKKSRFEPLPAAADQPPPARKDMNSAVRAKYLDEEVVEKPTVSKNVKTEENSLKNSLVFDRFVAAKQADDVANILEPVKPSDTTHGTKEMRDAVKLKMFGPITRTISDWQPSAILCKRFNVPEPKLELQPETKRKRTKNLIFEYQQHSEENIALTPGLSVKENSQENTQIKKENAENTIVEKIIEPEKEISENPHSEESSVIASDVTEKVDISKNLDLFKAVFLSSSESDDDDDNEGEPDKNLEETALKNEEIKNNLLSDNLLLTNIQPIKQGILSNIDFTKLQTDTPKIDTNETVPLYGPILPQKMVNLEKTEPNALNTKNESDSDEWVEKSDKKRKKRDKKDKHKHKKKKKKH